MGGRGDDGKGVCNAIVPMKRLITLEGRAEGKSPLEGIHWGSKLRVNKPMGRTEEGSEVIQKGTREGDWKGSINRLDRKKAVEAEPINKE